MQKKVMVSSSLTRVETYSFTIRRSKRKDSRRLKKVKRLNSISWKALADHKQLT